MLSSFWLELISKPSLASVEKGGQSGEGGVGGGRRKTGPALPRPLAEALRQK